MTRMTREPVLPKGKRVLVEVTLQILVRDGDADLDGTTYTDDVEDLAEESVTTAGRHVVEKLGKVKDGLVNLSWRIV